MKITSETAVKTDYVVNYINLVQNQTTSISGY